MQGGDESKMLINYEEALKSLVPVVSARSGTQRGAEALAMGWTTSKSAKLQAARAAKRNNKDF